MSKARGSVSGVARVGRKVGCDEDGTETCHDEYFLSARFDRSDALRVPTSEGEAKAGCDRGTRELAADKSSSCLTCLVGGSVLAHRWQQGMPFGYRSFRATDQQPWRFASEVPQDILTPQYLAGLQAERSTHSGQVKELGKKATQREFHE